MENHGEEHSRQRGGRCKNLEQESARWAQKQTNVFWGWILVAKRRGST